MAGTRDHAVRQHAGDTCSGGEIAVLRKDLPPETSVYDGRATLDPSRRTPNSWPLRLLTRAGHSITYEQSAYRLPGVPRAGAATLSDASAPPSDGFLSAPPSTYAR